MKERNVRLGLQLLEDFNSTLQHVSLVREKQDDWVWMDDSSGCFTTKSGYDLIVRKESLSLVHPNSSSAIFMVLWKCKVPSKVLAFSWQVFLDRIPTKVNLLKRGVNLSIEEQRCVFCNSALEDSEHLFLSCSFSMVVWGKVYGWLGVLGVQPSNIIDHFAQHRGLVGGENRKKLGGGGK